LEKGEKGKKGISRSKLLGMNVYNPDGSFVGTIKDVSLAIETGEMGLLISTKYQTEVEIPWSNVSAAEDVMILKKAVSIERPPTPAPTVFPVVPTAPVTPTVPVMPTAPVAPQERRGVVPILKGIVPKREKRMCPTCGKRVTFVKDYNRWYCYNCGKYVE